MRRRARRALLARVSYNSGQLRGGYPPRSIGVQPLTEPDETRFPHMGRTRSERGDGVARVLTTLARGAPIGGLQRTDGGAVERRSAYGRSR